VDVRSHHLLAALVAKVDAQIASAGITTLRPPPVNELIVTVISCSHLAPRESSAVPSPFVTYKLLQFPEYLTVRDCVVLRCGSLVCLAHCPRH